MTLKKLFEIIFLEGFVQIVLLFCKKKINKFAEVVLIGIMSIVFFIMGITGLLALLVVFITGFDNDIWPLLLMIVLSFTLISAAGLIPEFEKVNAITESKIVEVVVVNKEYTPSRTMVITSGKVTVPVRKSPKYEITISDGEHTDTLDNKELYDQVEIGDKFNMQKLIYKNRKGEIIDVDFVFEGEE